MKFNILLAVVICVSFSKLFAQDDLDSLWKTWNDPTLLDTVRLEAINKIIIRGYLHKKPDSAYHLAQKQYDFATRNGIKKYQALARQTQGRSLSLRADLDDAFKYLSLGLELYEEIGDKNGVAASLNSIGANFYEQGKYAQALDYFIRSLSIVEEIGHKRGMSILLSNIGSIYVELGQYDQALDYHTRGLAIKKELGNKNDIAISLNNIGLCYYRRGEYVSALDHHNRSLAISEEIDDKRGTARSLNNIGLVYTEQGKYALALDHHIRSLALAEEVDDRKEMVLSLNNIGLVSIKTEEYNEVIKYCERSLEMSQKLGLREHIKDAAQSLYLSYKKTGNFVKALEMHELYQITKDSIVNEDKTRELIRLEFNYEYEKEKQELAFRQDREVSRLEWIIYSSVGAFVLMFLLSYVIYRNYRSKQRANKVLKQQNQEIFRQKQELQEMDRFKSRFFANISHELRTPLSLILGPLNDLLNRTSKTNINKTLHLVIRNTNKLKGLVDDILDLSKLETKKMELQEEPVEIAAFLSRISDNYEPLASQLNIKYLTSFNELAPDWVLLDGKRVEKVINNLLFNAIKYTPAGGQIELKANRENGYLVIEVIDTGRGIAKEDLPYIFDRYFQSKQPDSPIQGGTGIGLALANELVSLMDGKLLVESELCHGSTFTVILPCKEAHAPIEDQLPDQVETKDNSNTDEQFVNTAIEGEHTVLIVEDNLDMQKYVQEMVLPHYRALIAVNGKEALKILKSKPIDLIISDVMMPEMDGFSLLENIKNSNEYSSIPVIMLTALDLEDKKMEALTLGADDYLTKPFSHRELLARAHNLIGRYDERKKWMKGNTDNRESDISADEGYLEAIDQKEINTQRLKWINRVKDVIIKELENTEFHVADLAREFHLSERQFLRRCKTITGLSPKQLQQEVALQHARKLLEQGIYGNVSAVAHSVGIYNVSHFSQMFVERFGKSPKEYFV